MITEQTKRMYVCYDFSRSVVCVETSIDEVKKSMRVNDNLFCVGIYDVEFVKKSDFYPTTGIGFCKDFYGQITSILTNGMNFRVLNSELKYHTEI